MFILSGSRTSSYEFLEKEPFETEYGVTGMVRERKEQFRETYVRNNVIGTCLCVLSVIPLFAGILIDEENDLLLCGMVCGMLAMIAVGVTFFIRVGTVWNSFQQLLQEGDYSPRNKKAFGVSGGYWVLVTAIYLACSFLTDRWDLTWIIWVAAAGLYSLLAAILRKRSEK
ncbi:predicted transcriptional regulators [Ruminococcus sp. CAG:379]|nr:predicted transcriptional regulators [Ruminococcus sp. CAG:379]